ncbi:MAG: hypothetical protein CO099_04455 [Bdellovibrio sp. CG_4_9_14_3_um_filter_39_7]|nr:MAG: hypothetical protein CO099_04455 [Bdellovibrio sp. CG_4_9_14_3_um_filter_39_7]
MALESWSFDNVAQNEALINELKGTLFEFRLAQELAQHFNLLPLFISQLPPELTARLQHYEMWLRQNDRALLKGLIDLGKQTSLKLIEHLDFSPENIVLTGKEQQSEWGEGDLCLIQGNRKQFISLKLCKDHAFVNTKSGGIKSFVEKYFGDSFGVPAFEGQKKISEELDQSFHLLGQQLYHQYDLGDFQGTFDERWPTEWLLPGQLPPEAREFIFQHYGRMIQALWRVLSQLNDISHAQFVHCLYPLFGFAHGEVLQLICYHGEEGENKYQLKKIVIRDKDYISGQLECLELKAPKNDLASMEWIMGELAFQLRVKPMNKINAQALKVNCSLKELR